MEITVKSQKRRREAPTYPAAAHRALLIVYPFLQKYFEKGVMIGSVKG